MSFAALIVPTTQSALAAASTVKVNGWAKGQNGVNVEVFNADGTQAATGHQDLSSLNIKGLKPHDPIFDLVEVDSGKWVMASTLNLVFCEQKARVVAVAGGQKESKTLAFGSGEGCPK